MTILTTAATSQPDTAHEPDASWVYEWLEDFAQARAWFAPAPGISARRAAFFAQQPPDKIRARLMLGQHDRGEAFCFMGGPPLPHADLLAHQAHFPAPFQRIALHSLHLRAGQEWEIKPDSKNWSGSKLAEKAEAAEKFYCLIRVGHLQVEPGARLAVHGCMLLLACERLELVAPPSLARDQALAPFEIALLPSASPPFKRRGAHWFLQGSEGAKGADGAAGSGIRPIATPFGALLDEQDARPRDGEPGAPGGEGQRGRPGRNGSWQMLADLRLGAVEGFAAGGLCVRACAGDGEAGQRGGAGGRGGDGGDGGDGARGLQGDMAGGRGGAGGNGGAGGQGGNGGHGGLASPVLIEIPETARAALMLVSSPSQGGAGGANGLAGVGGAGGRHGKFAPDLDVPAQMGLCGRNGLPGRQGRSLPGAKFHVFSPPQTGGANQSEETKHAEPE